MFIASDIGARVINLYWKFQHISLVDGCVVVQLKLVDVHVRLVVEEHRRAGLPAEGHAVLLLLVRDLQDLHLRLASLLEARAAAIPTILTLISPRVERDLPVNVRNLALLALGLHLTEQL